MLNIGLAMFMIGTLMVALTLAQAFLRPGELSPTKNKIIGAGFIFMVIGFMLVTAARSPNGSRPTFVERLFLL